MSYYRPHDSLESGRINIARERPVVSWPGPGENIMEHAPGPRTRIVIEGENDYVERLYRAMAAELQAIRDEIEAA